MKQAHVKIDVRLLRRKSGGGSWTPVFDYMLALLGIFLILAITEKPKAKPSTIPTYGQYAVVLTWEGISDIDLHVRDPRGQDVYFRSPDDKNAYLEHDQIPTYDIIGHPNRERTIIRQTLPGEWTVNTHVYGGDGARVTVTLYDIRTAKQSHVVTTETYTLSGIGSEHTAFRFVLDRYGNVRAINHLQTSFVRDMQ